MSRFEEDLSVSKGKRSSIVSATLFCLNVNISAYENSASIHVNIRSQLWSWEKSSEQGFLSRPPSEPVGASRVSFLDLPKHIRERIYDEANVGGDKFIDLNFWNIKNEHWQDHDDQQRIAIPDGQPSPFSEEPFPWALLRAGSHLVHDEVQAKLYAQNAFAVSLLGPQGLLPLEMLSNAALRELRVLIIALSPCRCLTHYCCKMNWSYGECIFWPRPRRDFFWAALRALTESRQHSKPLGCVSRTDKSILSQWRRVCARLAANARPYQLKLYLVAEVADDQTLNAIVGPLRSLPVLSEAAINLGHHLKGVGALDPKALARNTALSLTDRLQNQPFRFLDLPLELQMQIFQYTDLVDSSMIEWDPSERFRARAMRSNCRTKDEASSGDWTPFCSLEQTAAFSPRCECRASPLEYFLVSKSFAVAARSVLYACNEFRLLPSHYGNTGMIAGFDAHEDDGYYQLTLPSFLRRMPPQHVASLRHLTLVFPPLAPDYLLPDQRGWGEWVRAVERLAARLEVKPARLKLQVHLSDQEPLPCELPAGPDTLLHQSMRARRRRDETLEGVMLDTYRRILEPLQKLAPGLRALLIYVAWPLCRTAQGQRKADEAMLERMIMGEGYDSAKWGKRERSPYSQPPHGL
ncbi:hypothetical protein M406DRAFT_326504 [Cryphonectria parasitica EP155]|uniref:Uncharacterized protein n=1 Tax=Cryphonectria parasitica (strain ATCC 38755 / EP155) TaxID=660469 RepID=A0A9P4YDU5_CRYP1|nr:uncharacterized protein M406DRAFT_326504 [Cryphonectria parasitica EP155]KAF3771104.1 hypothetical protein M406DRAFT_326504 [Cryphonectria parasitica EP155]